MLNVACMVPHGCTKRNVTKLRLTKYTYKRGVAPPTFVQISMALRFSNELYRERYVYCTKGPIRFLTREDDFIQNVPYIAPPPKVSFCANPYKFH